MIQQADDDGRNCERPIVTQTYLTLGDGDFTFSLDLARYLHQQSRATRDSNISTHHLIATGLDLLGELNEKYRDANFVLNSLKRLSNNNDRLKVDIYHGVNAVSSEQERYFHADRVLFNHPHLGNEDCVVHSLFLCHFFHVCNERWLSRDGYLHLTLAHGQFERWNCLKGAYRHNLELVDQSPFCPPPVADKNYYQLRRHQTGKSFQTRTSGHSETFTFMRKKVAANVTAEMARLPWYSKANEASESSADTSFSCQYCNKSFREERSLKAHMNSKHADGSNKRKRKILCSHCPSRTFDSEESLHNHMRAKHTGLHTTILPDWCAAVAVKESIKEKPTITQSHSNEECAICGKIFSNETEATKHGLLFLPHSKNAESVSFTSICSFCGRTFREDRARLQHENSCARNPREQKRVAR
jgi:uncharacterized C2H2 Zn-finger protein